MNSISRALTTSSATEPKKSTWVILGKRFEKSGFESQAKWMDANLEKAGFSPKEWMKTGEMPSEMICRFARENKKTIDEFLLEVMNNFK